MEQGYFYSRISGYNMYERLSGEAEVPGLGVCGQMQHMDTGELFYAMKQEPSDAFYRRMTAVIESRLPDREWIWPCDLVENAAGECMLLFAMEAYPQYPRVLDVAERHSGIDDPQVLQTALWMLDRFSALWDNGFITADFDLSHYTYDAARNMGSIAFSTVTVAKLSAKAGEKAPFYLIKPVSRIADCRGLCDPYGFSEQHDQYQFDNKSFLIAVAATMFYLLIGRMPYDGALQDDDRYDMVMNPERFWGHCYAYRPYFIMDEIDGARNPIGEYPEEMEQLARFARLSPKLKEMFCQSLRHDGVMRMTLNPRYMPQEWKLALLEWQDSIRREELDGFDQIKAGN